MPASQLPRRRSAVHVASTAGQPGPPAAMAATPVTMAPAHASHTSGPNQTKRAHDSDSGSGSGSGSQGRITSTTPLHADTGHAASHGQRRDASPQASAPAIAAMSTPRMNAVAGRTPSHEPSGAGSVRAPSESTRATPASGAASRPDRGSFRAIFRSG